MKSFPIRARVKSFVRRAGRPWSRNHRARVQSETQLCEALESRQLLAVIAWDGGPSGDGTDLDLAANWVGDVLPGPADDVTIGSTGTNPLITLASELSFNSITSSRALQMDFDGNLTTAAINTLTAKVTINGGILTGGTWSFAGTGNRVETSAFGGTLASVTILGDVVLSESDALMQVSGTTTFTSARLQASAASLRLATGYTLNSPVVAEGAAGGTRRVVLAPGTTIGPSGSIRLLPGSGGGLDITRSFTGGLVNNGLISAEAPGQTLTISSFITLTNNGTLRTTAGAMSVSSTSWTNPGTITGTGGTLNLAGNWSSAGTIAINGTAVNLGGTFNTNGGIGTWSRSGGTVNLTGTLSNAGSTLTLNNATGSWNLLGGTVSGGTLSFAHGQTLNYTFSGGTLSNVTINGDVVLAAPAANVLVSGTTSFTATRLQGSSTSLRLATGYTLNSPVTVEGAAQGTRIITLAAGGPGINTIGPSGSIRLLAGAGGGLDIVQGTPATLLNNGLISAEASERALSIASLDAMTNGGTLRITAGTLSVNATGWTNPGTITGTGGTLNLAGSWSTTGTIAIADTTATLGGTFNATVGIGTWNRSGGTVNVTGTLNNTGSTITLNNTTGSWNLNGGTINGGTVSFSDDQTLNYTSSSGTLSNVAINGNMVLGPPSGSVVVLGTTSFTAAWLTGGSRLLLGAGYTLNSPVFASGSTVVIGFGGTEATTIGPSGSIRLLPGSSGGLEIVPSIAGTLVNNGLISAEATGQQLLISSLTNLTNNGTLRVTAGIMSLILPSWTNPGTITGTGGTVSLTGSWSSTGTISLTDTTINLVGTFTTASLAGLTRTGGTVNLIGTLNNTGSTLTLNKTTGSWDLLAGTVNGGTLSLTDGQTLNYTASGGTLENVTVNGDVVLSATSANVLVSGTTTFTTARLQGAGATLRLNTGYTLNSPVVVEGSATGFRFVTPEEGGSGTTIIGPSGSIRHLSGAVGELRLNAGLLVNNGLISAEAPDEQMSIFASTLINNGTLRVRASTMLVNSTNWTNPGATIVDEGTLDLAGTLTSASLAGFTRTGGTVNLRGTYNNAGSTLTLNNSTGSWNLRGGTVSGGTLSFADGQTFDYTSPGGTLLNVTVNGELVLPANASVLVSGTTSFMAARLQGGSARLRLATGYMLSSPVFVEGAETGTRFITLAAGQTGTNTIGPSGSIRLLPGSGGGLEFRQGGQATLVNNGLISAEASGQELSLPGVTTLTNNATLRVTAGTMSLNSANWTNPGTIIGTGGTLNLASGSTSPGTISLTDTTLNLGGTFTTASLAGFTRTGGTVNLTGTVNNTGSTLTLNNTTGSWNLVGGTLHGGTLSFVNGQTLNYTPSGGTLSNLAINGDVVLSGSDAFVRVSGTTTFITARLQSAATLLLDGGYTLNSPVLAEGSASGTRIVSLGANGPNINTIGPSGSIRLLAGSGGPLSILTSNPATLVNSGLISAESSTQQLSIFTLALTNNGTINLSASSTVNVPSFTQTASGSLTAEFAGTDPATQFSRVIVDGTANLAGSATLLLTGGYTPTAGTSLAFISAASRTGTFSTVALPANFQPFRGYSVGYSASAASLVYDWTVAAGTWIGLGDGVNWADGQNWARFTLPTAADDVVINVTPGTPTITIASGTQIARTITSNRPLLISGGSLSVAQASTFSQLVTVGGGTLTGAGDLTFAGGLTLNSGGGHAGSGNSIVPSGAAFIVNAPFSNQRPLQLNDALVTINGTFTNGSTINYNASVASTFAGSGTFFNAATFIKSGLATLTVPLNVSSPATLNITGGTLEFTGGGTIGGTTTIAASATLGLGGNTTYQTTGSISGGTLRVRSGATANLGGSVSGSNVALDGGTTFFDITGTIGALTVSSGAIANAWANINAASATNAGRLNLSTQTLNTTGNFTQTSTGTLDLRASSVSAFGRVNAGGSATLGGTLRFTPTTALFGQSFQLIQATSRIGTFDTLQLPTVRFGVGRQQTAVNYSATGLSITLPNDVPSAVDSPLLAGAGVLFSLSPERV